MYLKKSIILVVSLFIIGVYNQGPPKKECNTTFIEKCNKFTSLLTDKGKLYGGCICYKTSCYIDHEIAGENDYYCNEIQTKACSDFCENEGNECYKYIGLKNCGNEDKKDTNGECWEDKIYCSITNFT